MSNPDSSPAQEITADVENDAAQFVAWIKGHAKRHATPYHLTVAAVLGGITAVFVTVIALLIIVSLNFNVLGWVE